MKRLNLILTLTSLSVLLVTIERFSFTTKIILQPDSFLRLHEVIQMVFIILLTVILPFFLLKELSQNFALLKTKKGISLALLFIIGVYFYATGNGVHELASYFYNSFCVIKHNPIVYSKALQCRSMFFNDYYFGNIVYFIGALLFTIPLLVFERMNPDKTFKRNDFIVLFANAFLYSFAIFAYAAFDVVLIGLVYGIVASIVILLFLFSAKTKYRYLPFTLYSTVTYVLATVASIIVRLH